MKYDYWTVKSPLHKFIQGVRNKLYDSLIKPGSVVQALEIGSGHGEFARWCRLHGAEYTGLEPNPTMRNALSKEDFRVYPWTIPNELCALKYGQWDLIFCAHVIEHLKSHEEISNTFIQLKDHYITKNSRLVLLYPDISKIKELFHADYTHSYPTTVQRVNNILRDCGYTILRTGHYSGPFTNPFMVSLMQLIFMYIPMPQSWRERIQVCGYTIAIPRQF